MGLSNSKAPQVKEHQNRQQTIINKSFTFDLCFDEYTTQEAMFAESGAKELIDLALQGYSTTIFAYGQTGSGKTFTISGDGLFI